MFNKLKQHTAFSFYCILHDLPTLSPIPTPSKLSPGLFKVKSIRQMSVFEDTGGPGGAVIVLLIAWE